MLYLRPVLVLGLTMLALSQILGWLRSRFQICALLSESFLCVHSFLLVDTVSTLELAW